MSRIIKNISYIVLCVICLAGCSGLAESENEKIRQKNAVGERIHRCDGEKLYAISPPVRHERDRYPWEEAFAGSHARITKEYFRCRGRGGNPHFTRTVKGNQITILDCEGMDGHSLPYKDGKEFIYPALITLLNYLQEKTQKKVIITSAYRCPSHNTYADGSKMNQTSKHMIGAEVDFYVQGMEWSPEEVVELLMAYYREEPRFKEEKKFVEFARYEKDTNVTTLPWYNKEIFIKLFQKDEGRDQDNDHSFPYVCIQLKWDRDEEKPVTYSWKRAFNGYLRY